MYHNLRSEDGVNTGSCTSKKSIIIEHLVTATDVSRVSAVLCSSRHAIADDRNNVSPLSHFIAAVYGGVANAAIVVHRK